MLFVLKGIFEPFVVTPFFFTAKMQILLAPEVLFCPAKGPPGRSKPVLNRGHKCQLPHEPAHQHLSFLSLSLLPLSLPLTQINTLTHTRKVSTKWPFKRWPECKSSFHTSHALPWVSSKEWTRCRTACSCEINLQLCAQRCLVPTGMRGI